MTESILDRLQSKMIAKDLNIKPEQVTLEFTRKMRKRMEGDPQFKFDDGSDPKIWNMSREEEKLWNEKCRAWAQEVIIETERPA